MSEFPSLRLFLVRHAQARNAPCTPVLHDFPIANASISELIHWPGGRMTGGAPRYTEFASVGSADHLPPECRSDN